MSLNRRDLILAALTLVDTEGAEALTMKRLADAVDRRAPSLYNHINSRQDLIEGMRSLIVEQIDTAPFAHLDWAEALQAWGRSYQAAFAAHPKSITLLATTSISDPTTYVMYEVVIAALVQAGWPPGEAIALMRAVEAYVLGSCLDLAAPVSLLSAAAVPPGLPALQRGLTEPYLADSSASAAFELGLRALMAGFRAHMSAPSSG